MDNRYQFLTRQEAWKVAQAAGQIKIVVVGMKLMVVHYTARIFIDSCFANLTNGELIV